MHAIFIVYHSITKHIPTREQRYTFFFNLKAAVRIIFIGKQTVGEWNVNHVLFYSCNQFSLVSCNPDGLVYLNDVNIPVWKQRSIFYDND